MVRLGLTGAALLILLGGTGFAAEPAADLAARIDRRLLLRLEREKVTPAPRADDAEFLRRVYLDLAGRIPSLTEARTFLDDAAPDKRDRLIGRLLAGGDFVNHFSSYWRALLLPDA